MLKSFKLLILFLLATGLYAQGVSRGAANRQFRAAGAPPAGLCNSAGDVGKMYARTDADEAYDCLPDGGGGWAWKQRGGGGVGSGDITAVGTCTTGSCFQSVDEHKVFIAPSGSAGVGEFRLLEVADIPDLDSLYATDSELTTAISGLSATYLALANLVTTVGDPGSDSSVPTEQAVREALDALSLGVSEMGPFYCPSSTASDTYTATCTPANPASYVTGMLVIFKTTVTTNTDGASININSLGAKNIVTAQNSTLASGMLSASSGEFYYLQYDGTSFRLIYSDRSIPSSTDFQYARLTNDGTVANWSFKDIIPASGLQDLTADTDQIDCDRRTVTINPDAARTLTSTPSITAGTADGDVCIIKNPTSNQVTVQGEENLTGSTLVNNGEDLVIPAKSQKMVVWDQSLLKWVGPAASATSSSETPLQGFFMPSQDSTSANLALSGADKIYVQSIFIPQRWTIQYLVAHWNAADSLGSACLYSWGGGSTTTANLVASTTPASLTSTSPSHMAISQGSVEIGGGWYLLAFTGHQGTLGVKRGVNAAYLTPITAQELNSGVTDGSCPSSLSGLSPTVNFTSYTNQWRIGWRY
jgi:hypothetical protein